MANLPNLTPEQVQRAIPEVSDAERIGSGGQKVVFRVRVDEKPYALKLALVPELIETEEGRADVVSTRARREVETIRDCTSTHMVKLGPIGLTFAEIEGQKVLYFTEEFVAGQDLRELVRTRLAPIEVLKLGLDMTDAIKGLWDLGKVHRDVKPGNIMRREDSGQYVLLDAGLAFDVVGESLSAGLLVGTMAYFSPEQFDYSTRRSGFDFRSDMFSLGVTMYEASTGKHPFAVHGMDTSSLYARILEHNPDPPSALIEGEEFPEGLDEIILRMLGKSQHLRFRTCERLAEALRKVG